MALRVGMRVKKVRGLLAIGVTGVVVSCSAPEESSLYYGDDIVVRIDVNVNDRGKVCAAGQDVTSRADEWEPIQPEGHKPVEWSQCLWQPEHIREGVSA